MSYMSHALATLKTFQESARFTDPPPGTCPEDYDYSEEDDGVDPDYDGILGEG